MARAIPFFRLSEIAPVERVWDDAAARIADLGFFVNRDLYRSEHLCCVRHRRLLLNSDHGESMNYVS